MKLMLCSPATLEEAKALMEDGEWIVEEKYDGIRAVVVGGRLYDRRGKDITAQFPELEVERLKVVGVPVDGEVLCEDFAAVQSRMHTKDKLMRRLLAQKYPARFFAFDVVVQGYPLWARKEKLYKLDAMFPWLVVVQASKDAQRRWEEVLAHQGEGIVVKRMDSLYEEGVRSKTWLKVKAWKETVAEFVKLDEHPKGVRLETADGRAVNVNGRDADEVRRIFREKGVVVCEVQYLPQPESEAWRFPSFRGVRE